MVLGLGKNLKFRPVQTSTRYVSWSNRIGICMDAAATLRGHKKGFQAEEMQVSLHHS
jgi:hypothetical protein